MHLFQEGKRASNGDGGGGGGGDGDGDPCIG